MRSENPIRAAKISYIVTSVAFCVLGILLIVLRNWSVSFIGVVTGIMLIAFGILSYYVYLLKTVNSTLPTTNTQDIMLLSAWATMLLSFVVGLRFRILLPLGFVVSAVMLGISIFASTI